MYYRIQKLLFLLLTVVMTLSTAKAADLYLSPPQMSEGMGVFETLKKRVSTPGGAFSTGKIPEQDLSTLLWAASGLNRGQNGWTVPMANGTAPYINIYVADEQGTFLYHWNGHYLQQINQQDIRADVALQSFVRRAAYLLIFVSDSQILAEFNDNELANNFSQMAVGAISQNVYLAATALRLDVRYIHSIKTEVIRDELKLAERDIPIGLMLISK